MKPSRSGMDSAAVNNRHLHIIHNGRRLRHFLWFARPIVLFAATLALSMAAPELARLAGAAAPADDEKAVPLKKKSASKDQAKNDTSLTWTPNPRGEPLQYENAATQLSLLGPTMWAATLSSDGKTIVTAHGTAQSRGEIRIWDREKARVKQTISYDKGIRSVVFSPDGKILVSSGFEGVVRFHDPTTFTVWAIGDESSGGHKSGGVNMVRFFKSGQYLASAGFDNTIRVWDVPAILEARKSKDSVHVSPVAIFEGHTQRVLSAVGSEDGLTLLSGSADRSARVWDVPDPLPKMGEKPIVIKKERHLLGGHQNGVEGIAISHDGQLVVTSAWGGLMLLRNRDGTKTELSVQMPGGVMCATFSRDGKYLAIGCGVQENPNAKEVRVWEVETKKEVARRVDFEEGVKGLEFTPDGKTLIAAIASQTVHVWPWAEPKDQQTLNSPDQGYTSQPLLAAALSRDGSLLAFSGESQTVFVYNRTESKVVAMLTGHEDVVAALAFSPDGKTLASASYDRSIKLWNTETWKEHHTLTGHTGWVFNIAFSPDGQTLASGSYDKTLRLWNTKTGESKATLNDHSAGIRSVAFSPDGKRLVSGGSDRILRVWDVAKEKVTITLKGHKNAVRSVAFSPDGKTIASGSEDRTVKFWDAESGKETNTFSDLPDMVTALRFSPKGQTLAAATYQGAINLIDPLTNRVRQTLRAHNESVSAVEFTEDGQTIISASLDRTIRQWTVVKTAIATPLQTLTGKPGVAKTIATTPNGTVAVLGCSDGSITVWKPKTDTLQPYVSGHSAAITHLAISDEMQIASVDKDSVIIVGNLTGGETWKSKGSFAEFTPDGKRLAIANGKEIALHDAKTGRQMIRFFGGHDGNVVRLAFSPDGTRMISAGDDTKVRLWDASTGESLQETPPFGNYAKIIHLTFSPDGSRFAAAAYGPEQPPPDDMDGMFRVVREIRIFTLPKPEAVFDNPVVYVQQQDEQPLTSLHWGSQGQMLVSTAFDGTVRLAELGPNGATERQRYRAHEAAVLASSISHEGGVFITIGEDMAVRRWRLPGSEQAPGQARVTPPGISRVWDVLPSPDNKYVVSVGEGEKQLSVSVSQPSAIPMEPDNYPAVMTLAFSPNNRFLVTGHDKGIVVVRDAITGKPIRTLQGLTKRVASVAFAENGDALIAVGGNWGDSKERGEALVWNFQSGQIRHTLDAPGLQWMVAVHPDGKTAAIAGDDGKIRVWDVMTGKSLKTLGKGGPGLKTVTFDSTGNRIAAGGGDRSVRIWNASTGEELKNFSTAPLLPTKVLFSPNGKEIVVSAWKGDGQADQKPALTAYSLDDKAAPPRQFTTHPASVMGLAFLPDGKTLIAAGGEASGFGSLKIYDFATAKYLGQLSGHRNWAQSVTVSPDGKLVASTSWGQPSVGELRLWNPLGFMPIAELKVAGENQRISSAAIGLNGKLLVLCGSQTLTAWDMTDPTKPVLRKQIKDHTAAVKTIAFDESGQQLVSADEGGTVKVWDAATLELIVSFKASTGGINRAKFTPDGSRLVTISSNSQGQVKSEMIVWEAKTGKEAGRFPDQPRVVWDFAFLNGGKQIVTVQPPGGGPNMTSVMIWDMERKVVLRRLLPPGTFNDGRCLAVSRDGKHLAVGSNAGPVKVFVTGSWQEALNLTDLSSTTFHVNFTNDSNSLLVASGEAGAIALRLPQ